MNAIVRGDGGGENYRCIENSYNICAGVIFILVVVIHVCVYICVCLSAFV